MSRTYSIKTVQKIPAAIDQIWDFFSSAENLAEITPTALGFQIVSSRENDKIYAGQIIEYTVRPLLNIPLYWMTEITHVSDKKYFIDEQRYGPYSLWHHQHHFTEIKGGVEMTDIVHYKIPFWILGDVANALFVKAQLQNIFDFRFEAVTKKFGVWDGDQNKNILFR